jgi:hypothetical protein
MLQTLRSLRLSLFLPRGRPVAAVVASILIALTACKRPPAPANPSAPTVATTRAPGAPPPRPAYLASLTDAEFKYGASPTRTSEVTYQDDVIIMEHGAEAIRQASPDGLTWTIDANAPSAKDIEQGKIVFATGRAVGRVLVVNRSGSDLTVTLGPVELTDVVKDAKIKFDQTIDVNEMVAYTAPEYPGAATDLESFNQSSDAGGRDDGAVTVTPVAWTGGSPFRTTDWAGEPSGPCNAVPAAAGAGSLIAQAARIVAPIVGLPGAMDLCGFTFTPFASGLGVDMVRNGDDAKIHAYAIFRLEHPSLSFDLVIAHGTIVTSEVQLNGAAGLTVQLEASSLTGGLNGNINKTFYVPVDLSLPIIGKALPLAMTFRQTLLIQTAFTAKTSTLTATGDYKFTGSLSAGLRNGNWGVGGPTSFHTNVNLADSMGGNSLGVNGLVFGYGARVIVGIGAFGFVTGPFVGVSTVVGLTKGSDLSVGLGVQPCRSAILDMTIKVGVGFAIPEPLRNVLNFVLGQLHAAPIEGSGGPAFEQPLIHKADKVPNGCAGGSDAAPAT